MTLEEIVGRIQGESETLSTRRPRAVTGFAAFSYSHIV